MTEAERLVAEAKANAPEHTKTKTSKNKTTENTETALALAADAQYKKGLAITKAVLEASMLRGVQDALDGINSDDIDSDELIEIAAKFEEASSKKLKSAEPLILPFSAWMGGESA